MASAQSNELERRAEEEPIGVSKSTSTVCETDKRTGELKCHTLEQTWKQFADGRIVTEERRIEPSLRSNEATQGLHGPEALLEGMLGEFGRALGSVLAPELGLRERARTAQRGSDEAPPGGEWT